MHWITPTAGAILLGSFHALVVALPLVSTGGSGEGQAFAVMIFDLPLVALLSLFEAGKSLLYNGPPLAYVAVFAVVGTLMYCAAGALAGLVAQRLIRAVRSRPR